MSDLIRLPPHVIDRVTKKRGRLRIFDRFDPYETALVVIDMQYYYLTDLPSGLAIIPIINRLAATFRERGALVAWVSMTVGRDGRTLWPLYHDYFFDKEGAKQHREGLTDGAPSHELHRDLATLPSDIFANKSRFSAFLPGRSDLPEKLASRGILNVAIAGVATNICCETSARDAMMLDYRVAMIADANAARNPKDHDSGFTSLIQSFGDVVTSKQMIEEILWPPNHVKLAKPSES